MRPTVWGQEQTRASNYKRPLNVFESCSNSRGQWIPYYRFALKFGLKTCKCNIKTLQSVKTQNMNGQKNTIKMKIKIEGKVHPRRGHEGPDVE